MNRNALIFDIETSADLTPEDRAGIAALAEGREMTPEQYGGLCPPLARVVCISWLDVTTQRFGVFFDTTLCAGECSGSIEIEAEAFKTRTCEVHGCDGEADLLRRFGRMVEQHLGKGDAHLVTYNGRGFDLPVLIHRSIKHRVTEGRHRLLEAVTENRYRPRTHVDLMDAVTFYGASGRWPLAAYAIGYGWPSPKQDLEGSQVWGAVQAGHIADVVRHCANDVLATTHVYLCMNSSPPGSPREHV